MGNGSAAPFTESLQSAFFGSFTGKTPDKYGWLEPVETKPARTRAAV